MAVNISNSRKKRRIVSEINVTPMVDVMLVLLVIFMITTPMLVGGVDVDLPKAKTENIAGQFEPLVISIDKNLKLYVGQDDVTLDSLPVILEEKTAGDKEKKIFVKGDKSITHGTIIELMALIGRAGFKKVSFISDLEG